MQPTEAAERPRQLYMSRCLKRCQEGFDLEARLEMPARMSPQELLSLLGGAAAETPSRAEILLQRPNGDRALIALMNEVFDADGQPCLRLDRRPSRTGSSFRGADASGSFALWIGEGATSHGPLEFAGSRLSGHLPWVFRRQFESELETWQLFAEGAWRSPEASLGVALPSGWRLEIEEGRARALGELKQLGRAFHEVSGRACLRGPEGLEATIETSKEIAAASEYRLVGVTEPFGTGRVFRGEPRAVAFRQGAPVADDHADIEWRSATSCSSWRRMSPQCLGRVWLRVREDGALRLVEQVDVLPVDGQIGLEPAANGRPGQVVFDGLAGARVGWAESAPAALRAIPDSAGIALEAPLAAAGKVPSEVHVKLVWDDQRQLILALPFPVRGARFLDRNGRLLAVEEQISVDRLAGIRAIAAACDARERFSLSARLLAEDVDEDLEIVEEMPRWGRGRFELDLGLLQERFRKMLSESQLFEATVRLRVESDRGSLAPRPIQVARFEASLTIDDSAGLVKIDAAAAPIESLHVEALPLWEPGRQPLALVAADGGFRFDPAAREQGPWLLYAWDGDWCRYRPTSWTVGEEGRAVDETRLTTLQLILRLASRDERAAALPEEIERLAATVEDPGWQQIDGCLDKQDLLPTGTFDLLRELVRHSEAAVGALARAADGERFRRIWSVLEQLPFSWRLVPLDAWSRALAERRRALLEQEGAAHQTEELLRAFLDIAAGHLPFMRGIADWLRATLLADRVAEAQLSMPQTVLEGLLEVERQNLSQRAAERWWPRGRRPDEWLETEPDHLSDPLRRQLQLARAMSAYKQPVLLAPLVAAFSCALGLSTRPLFLFDMRQMRAFDTRFFDLSYEYGLRLALSVLIAERRS